MTTRHRTLLVSAAFILLNGAALAASDDFSFSQRGALQRFMVIPSTLAWVTDGSTAAMPAGAFPDYILVQDVHKHAEVQSEIASLILLGYRHWGVRKVFLEGAFARVDLSLFHRLPQKTREALLHRLVNEGNLSGAELASVLLTETEWSNPRVSPFQLIGMEDASLYKQNVAAYESEVAVRDQALEELESIRRLQAQLQLPSSNVLTQQLERTEKLIRLKMMPDEYAFYLADKAMIPSSPRLDPAVKAAELYYSLVELRSHAFIRLVRKRVPAAPGPRMIIVGGYHTVAMADELRQMGKTFIVLRPHITEGGYEPLYEERMMENASTLDLPATSTTSSTH